MIPRNVSASRSTCRTPTGRRRNTSGRTVQIDVRDILTGLYGNGVQAEGIIPFVPKGETLHLAVLSENLLGGHPARTPPRS